MNASSVSPDEKYFSKMTERERLAAEIAQKHFGVSFDMRRTIGFQKFLVSVAQEQQISEKDRLQEDKT